ncbi:cupin domain-containing protein, partial [Pseudonocardia sp.]|uniref:cupin domain-containing protein n=1 Tax=Pseudonocardia sp. TaxID=60912 RepID=UPI002604AEE7
MLDDEEMMMSDVQAPQAEIQSWNSNTQAWEVRHIDELDGDIAVKPLIEDSDTGMSVMKLKYFAGFTNTWHTHNCAHGMYVLDGVLKTSAGSFGPGEFVWFPEGKKMEHGATADNDVTVLFITNKPLDIHYLSGEDSPAASD